MRKDFQEVVVSTNKNIESNKRWRLAHPEKRNQYRKKNYHKTLNLVTSEKTRWTQEEINIIMTSRLSDFEIAKQFNRSAQAIQVKRSRILKELNQE